MKFYHAEPIETMRKIINDGKIKRSWDGVVYLCKEPIDACKFLVIRGMRKVCVIEVDVKEEEAQESFDHAESFFRCKAFTRNGDIELTGKERVFEYEFEI